MKTNSYVPIAIVGVAALFPGSKDCEGFWRDIVTGKDLLSEVPPTHWLIDDYYDPDPSMPDKIYAKRGSFLGKIDFDPLEFGIPPTNLAATDTSQLLALIVAKSVLEEASQNQLDRLNRERVSVILGVTSGQELFTSMASRLQKPIWLKALREHGIDERDAQQICSRISGHYQPWVEATFPGLLGNVIAGRIANRFDLHGTNCITDAACASSFSAISMGINELMLGQADLVIAGGVDAMNDPCMFSCFSKTPALSPSGDCRPFSDQADGTMLGEGLAMFALKRLSDAEAENDRIYAVLRGIGSSSDGRSKSIYAPLAKGQARALRRAYDLAGYGPETVELIEAHGTGTVAGDAAEFAALREVFDSNGRPDRQWCALGSVKSQIGHTKATAGAAGLLKAIMAIHHKILPPTIKIERPNPQLMIETSPFYLNTQARPWIRDSSLPRRASVSAFGFGGTNFHATLEEYQGNGLRAYRQRISPVELILYAAGDVSSLLAQCSAVITEDVSLTSLARKSQETFQLLKYRLAIVTSDLKDYKNKLQLALDRISRDPEAAFTTTTGVYYALGEKTGRVAFIFPGQGSQYINMGADIAMQFDEALGVWDNAAGLGLKLHNFVYPRPAFDEATRETQATALMDTTVAQPAIVNMSLSLLAILNRLGLKADCAAGHSLGELTALHYAGVFDQQTLLDFAQRRGELMAAASEVAPGAMLAVGCAPGELQDLIDVHHPDLVIANVNHPTQTVLSGTIPAIEKAVAELKSRKITAKRLPVSAAFHSHLVEPAIKPFYEFLAKTRITRPLIDVYGSANAAIYSSKAGNIRKILARQIAQPVRFVEQIEAMYSSGVRLFLEVGPGAVLSSFVDRILNDRPHITIPLDRKGKNGLIAFWEALASLAVNGAELNFSALWQEQVSESERRHLHKPRLSIPLNGANYGKPYPPPGGSADLPPPNFRSISTMKDNDKQDSIQLNGDRLDPSPEESRCDLIAAHREAQRLLIQCHTDYFRSMAESHAVFLRSMESSLAKIGTFNQAADTTLASISPHNSEKRKIPAAPAESAVESVIKPESVPSSKSSPEATSMKNQPLIVTAAPSSQVMASVPCEDGIDLEGLMLKVVAEKTAYPVEMLEPQMELEADLGIDSIKRVEILSALRERVPSLPEVDTSELGALRSLQEIVEYFRMAKGMADMRKTAPGENSLLMPAPTIEFENKLHLEALMMQVVSEKTGYPLEMLEPQMELEADLGIDSIKRVEILSALRERVPGLPELNTAELGALRSLQEVIEYLREAQLHHNIASTEDNRDQLQADVSKTLQRMVIREISAPRETAETPDLGMSFVITDDGQGIAKALKTRLVERGITAHIVSEVPAHATCVVFLGGLMKISTVSDALHVERLAFSAAKAVAARFESSGGVFVTVQDTGGDFGLSGAGERAWLAGISALTRTVALEWPKASVKAIDLEQGSRSPEELAVAIEQELFSGWNFLRVGLHTDGRRTTLRSEQVAFHDSKSVNLTSESVIVVTGGARGVTAAAIKTLARMIKPRIALIGRSSIFQEPDACANIFDEIELKSVLFDIAKREERRTTPADVAVLAASIQHSREIKATLSELQAAGVEARYISLDIRDASALDSALSMLRSDWGPISGIIHGAGVIADKLISKQTKNQFDEVFETKVKGLQSLLAATQKDPISLLCLFSSIVAWEGNAGQSTYAMANEVLNAVAAAEHSRRKEKCLVRSIVWGPWDGGMVTPYLRTHMQSHGLSLMSLEEGASAFAKEILSNETSESRVIILSRLSKSDTANEQ